MKKNIISFAHYKNNNYKLNFHKMKNQMYLLLFLATMILSVSSCKKDDPALTTDEAKAEIEAVSQEMANMVNSLDQGEAKTAVDDFFQISKKAVSSKFEDEEWFEDMIISLDEHVDFGVLENELIDDHKFYFANYLGKYTWNFKTQAFDKTTSDAIILEFPATETSTTNNAVITFSGYTDEQVTFDNENYYIPSAAHISVEIDGVELMAIHLNEAAYNSEFPFISTFDFSLFFSPMTTTLIYNENSKREYSYAQSLSDGVSTTGVDILLKLTKDLDEDLDETYLDNAKGKLFFNDISARYDANLAKIANYEDEPTEAQINSDISIDMYYKEDKVGHLLLEDEEIYIVYLDGTKENFEEAFSEFVDAIDSFLEDDSFVKKTIKKKLSAKQKVKLFKKTRDFKNTINFVKSFKK